MKKYQFLSTLLTVICSFVITLIIFLSYPESIFALIAIICSSSGTIIIATVFIIAMLKRKKKNN